MPVLQELSVEYAKKQPKQVDNLLEEAPILAMLQFYAATHALWNVYEELTDVVGGAFVEMDSVLPTVSAESELKKLDLAIMGGQMTVGEDKARVFGGPVKYFARKMPSVLKQTGISAERSILYDNLRAYAIDKGKVLSAGSTTDTNYTMIAVRFEEGVCGGLYSPDGFKNGAMMDTKALNGGSLYDIGGGVNGYGIRLKNYFGFMIAGIHNVAAIVNIKSDKVPTEAQIDDLLDLVRAQPGNTHLYCHRKVLTYLGTHKEPALRMSTSDKNYDRRIASWNGIPIITSYNFDNGTEAKVTVG